MFKSKAFVIIQYILFTVASLWLVSYCFNKVNINAFYQTIIKGNYWVAILVLIFSVLVYISRILRWNIILNKVGENINFMNNFSSVALGYLVSFFFPRGGEVIKCMVLKRTNNLVLSKSVSSIFFERIIDTLCLFTLLTILFITELFSNHPILLNWVKPEKYFTQKNLILLAITGILSSVLIIFLYKKFKQKNNWLITFINNLKQLFGLILNLKFSFHTLFIWLSYYLMTYLWFFVFEQTAGLSLFQAFQIMMVGTIARSLPLPGGALGAYHLAVAYALTTMNIDKETALSLAFIIHGFQTVYTFIAGLVAIYWLFIKQKIYLIK